MDMKRIFAFLLGICLLFSGCFSFSEPPRSTPFSLQSGQQDFSLGTFEITEKGIEGLRPFAGNAGPPHDQCQSEFFR